MSGSDVRTARKRHGLNQAELATRLGVSQGYVSLVERNRRSVSRRLARKLVALLSLPASQLPAQRAKPLQAKRAAGALGQLGYPGFGYLRNRNRTNPSEVLVGALLQDSVDPRVVAALPWLLLTYPDLNWDWVVRHAKQHDAQNRLGFVVSLARGLAEKRSHSRAVEMLRKRELFLENSRLQKEDTFLRATLTESERKWLRSNRSDDARKWNLLTSLTVAQLQHAG